MVNEYNNTIVITDFNPLQLETFGKIVKKSDELRLDNAINAYCQSCGRDITNEGGIISVASKSVYCYGNNGKNCLDTEIIRMMKGEIRKMALGFHYLNPKQVQERIAQEKLTNFGSLEIKLEQ